MGRIYQGITLPKKHRKNCEVISQHRKENADVDFLLLRKMKDIDQETIFDFQLLMC